MIYKASCQKVLTDEQFNAYVPLEGEIVVKRSVTFIDGNPVPTFTVKMGKANGESIEFATTDNIGEALDKVDDCINQINDIEKIVDGQNAKIDKIEKDLAESIINVDIINGGNANGDD